MDIFDFSVYKLKEKFSGEEACKLIAQHWNDTPELNKTNKKWDWQDIWNYSPTGELSMVFIWFSEAFKYYRQKGLI